MQRLTVTVSIATMLLGLTGCGEEEPSGPEKSYVGRTEEQCATIRFTCEEGFEYFSDSEGCGCVEQ